MLTRYVKAFTGPDKTSSSKNVATCLDRRSDATAYIFAILQWEDVQIQDNTKEVVEYLSPGKLQTMVFLPADMPHLIEEITIGRQKKQPK